MLPESNSDLPPTRLCVIGEADPFLAQLLRRFAEKQGLQTLRAQTGEALQALIEEDCPALVILDPELPGRVRGWEVYEQVKRNAQACATPLIICTWLKEGEVVALLGQRVVQLKKPDLHYEDFTAALLAAGFQTALDEPDSVG